MFELPAQDSHKYRTGLILADWEGSRRRRIAPQNDQARR
jgi:hypothetical protein